MQVWSDIPVTEPPNAAVIAGRTHIDSYAGYGQASYELPDGFKLIGGLRTTYEQRELTEQTNFATNFLSPAERLLVPVDPSKNWTATNPKATFQWENPGQLLYASYSTGFKAGSYGLLNPGSAGPLDPEKIKAYEVGGKHDLPFLNHAHLDWAVFYYNYKNLQVSVQDPATGGEDASQNAASSINKGVDLDLADTHRPDSHGHRQHGVPGCPVRELPERGGLQHRGRANCNTPDYTKSVDATGNREERAPLLTSTVQLQWLLPISTGNISTTATYYHNSGFYLDAGDQFQQKRYNLANLHVQYAPQGDRWTVAAWVNNAFNATVIGGIGVSPYAVGAFYNDPRLYGLSASVHF